MANIVLNTSNVTEIKYVRNGTTTTLTELKYKKGSSGSATSVWANSTPSVTQGITCVCTATNVGTYYHLSLIFTRGSVSISDVSVKLEAYGTDLLNSSSYSFAQTFSTSFGASSGTWSKTLQVQKDTLTKTGFKVSYTDPIKGPVSYTGEFPITSFDWWEACPYIERSYFQWNKVSSGAEATAVYTDIQAAEYDCYVKLRYYLADSNTMGAATTFIGTSESLYIPAGECDTIETILPEWYGDRYMRVEICAVTFPDYPDKYIYLGDIMEEDEQFYYAYLFTNHICTDGRTLTAPSVTLEWVSDYDDMGDGTIRTNNTLYIDITNNNTTYGTVHFKATTYLGTADDNYALTTNLYANLGPGESKRLSTRVLDYTSGQVILNYSKSGFTGGSVPATFGNWAGGGDNTNTNTA